MPVVKNFSPILFYNTKNKQKSDKITAPPLSGNNPQDSLQRPFAHHPFSPPSKQLEHLSKTHLSYYLIGNPYSYARLHI